MVSDSGCPWSTAGASSVWPMPRRFTACRRTTASRSMAEAETAAADATSAHSMTDLRQLGMLR